jgi:hypothetical protein
MARRRQGHPWESSIESSQDGKWTERNTYMEKCAELGLKNYERRAAQDMVLVHKFLTEKGESRLFQSLSGQ